MIIDDRKQIKKILYLMKEGLTFIINIIIIYLSTNNPEVYRDGLGWIKK